MTTKKTLFFSLVMSVFIYGPGFSQTTSPFEFTDGYFTSNFGPVHLVHENVGLRAGLGGEYNLRVGFKVIPGSSNPCSRREEVRCRLIHQVVSRGNDGKEKFVAGWTDGIEFDVGDENIGAEGESVNFGIPSMGIPRTAITENNFLVIKIVKENKEIFRKEWPVEIR